MARPSTPPRPTPELIGALQDLIGPVVHTAGYDLEGVSVRNAGSRRVVRLLVDTDGGITLEQVAEVSRTIAAALDDSGAMGEAPYLLDVGSPGVDRPLTLHRHWRRNLDRLVRVVRTDGEVLVGRIRHVAGDADDAAPTLVRLDVDGREVDLDPVQVKRAVVQVEFREVPGFTEADDGDAGGDGDHEPEEGL